MLAKKLLVFGSIYAIATTKSCISPEKYVKNRDKLTKMVRETKKLF